MAENCLDGVGRALGAGLLEAIWRAEFSLLLRSGKFADRARPVARKPPDFFLASGRPAARARPLRSRSRRRIPVGQALHRRHRIYVRSGNTYALPHSRPLTHSRSSAAAVWS